MSLSLDGTISRIAPGVSVCVCCVGCFGRQKKIPEGAMACAVRMMPSAA